MASSITSLTIMGPTRLPDGADAAIGNGMFGVVTMADDGTTTQDATKISLTVQDPGYDAAGNALLAGVGGPVRTIVGTTIVRKQVPNNTQKLNSASGGVRTIYVAFSDFIYASSVISAAQDNGFKAGNVGAIGTVDKTAVTRPYQRPQFAWINQPGERSGATFNVECVAFSPYMRSGRQVAAVKVQGKDAAAHTSPQVTCTYGLSALVTVGNIPEVFKATIDCANLDQGAQCNVDAWVYPFMGDAPFQLSVNGAAWPTVRPDTQLRFACDKAGTWGGNIVYMAMATAAPAGVDTNAGTSAAPVLSLTKALQVLQAKNNAAPTAPTHNDYDGGIIRLKDLNGAPATFDPGSINSVPTGGKGYVTIEPDPANTSTATIDVNGSNMSHNGWIRFKAPIKTRGGWLIGPAALGSPIMFEGGVPDESGQGAGVPFTYQTVGYARNINAGAIGWSAFSTALSGWAAVIGTNGMSSSGYSACWIANRFIGGAMQFDPPTANTGQPNFLDGAVVYNNRLFKTSGNIVIGGNRGTTIGVSIVQNLIESTWPGPAISIWGDGTNTDAANVNVAYNTVPDATLAGAGSRVNHLYMDSAGDVGRTKEGHLKFNAFVNANNKSDPFSNAGNQTGRTGNWAARHKIGWLGNVFSSGQDGSTGATPDGTGWLGDAWATGALYATGAVPLWKDNKAGNGGVGQGDYRLSTSEVNLVGKVPAGMAGLTYDLAGATRYNDGNGAAGAYERDPLPISATEATTEGSDSLLAIGTLQLAASLAKTEDGDTVAAQAQLGSGSTNATSAMTEGNDTASGAATLSLSAALALTEGADTLASLAGPGPTAATATITEGNDTLAAASVATIAASAALQEGNDQLAALASIANNGNVNMTEGGDTLAAGGVLPLTAQLALVEQGDACLSTAFSPLSGMTAGIEANDTLQAAGSAPLNAQVAVVEAGDTLAAATVSPLTGTAALAEGNDTIAASSVSLLAGSASIQEGSDTLAAGTQSEVKAAVIVTEGADTLAAATIAETRAAVTLAEGDDTVIARSGLTLAVVGIVAEASDMLSAFGSVSPLGGFHAELALVEADDTLAASALRPIVQRVARLPKDKRGGLTVFKDRF